MNGASTTYRTTSTRESCNRFVSILSDWFYCFIRNRHTSETSILCYGSCTGGDVFADGLYILEFRVGGEAIGLRSSPTHKHMRTREIEMLVPCGSTS